MSMYDNRILSVFESIDRTLKRIAQILENEYEAIPHSILINENGVQFVPVTPVSEDDERAVH